MQPRRTWSGDNVLIGETFATFPARFFRILPPKNKSEPPRRATRAMANNTDSRHRCSLAVFAILLARSLGDVASACGPSGESEPSARQGNHGLLGGEKDGRALALFRVAAAPPLLQPPPLSGAAAMPHSRNRVIFSDQ